MTTVHSAAVGASDWSQRPRTHKLRDYAKFASLILNPSRRRASTLYDLVSTSNYFTERTLFRNLGYWRDSPSTLDDACEAMAQLAGEAAALSGDDRVLDAGFGFGDQDMYWMEHFSPREVVGLNVTQSQISLARQRVAQRGMSERIKLQYGSATSLPFVDNSFDKVIALESAFHFDTRERFFREAYRVLRPGGRIVLLDMIPMPNRRHPVWARLMMSMFCRIWQINTANMYSRDVYLDKLRTVGFADAKVDSIYEHVEPHFMRYVMQQLANPEVSERFNPALRWLFRPQGRNGRPEIPEEFQLDYVLAVADKAQ